MISKAERYWVNQISQALAVSVALSLTHALVCPVKLSPWSVTLVCCGLPCVAGGYMFTSVFGVHNIHIRTRTCTHMHERTRMHAHIHTGVHVPFHGGARAEPYGQLVPALLERFWCHARRWMGMLYPFPASILYPLCPSPSPLKSHLPLPLHTCLPPPSLFLGFSHSGSDLLLLRSFTFLSVPFVLSVRYIHPSGRENKLNHLDSRYPAT